MEDGEFKIGPSSKEELKKDLKDMMIQLWWVWLTLIPILVVGLTVAWKFRSVILSKLGF